MTLQHSLRQLSAPFFLERHATQLYWAWFLVFLFAGNPLNAQTATPTASILEPERFRHYIDYFNRMEDENIRQAIPNEQAWDWMKQNIPLFECPQDNFEEIYYFRWWSFRKHIRETPSGRALTEFLVPRSYADQYNLISCALGHHIMEGRWLSDKRLVNDHIRIWFRGNQGQPMAKLHKFSNWAAHAIYHKYLVDGDQAFALDLLPDLKNDYLYWETENLRPDGLFWQFDVRDGMEEQISGSRTEKNGRPTINSYMTGNALAISQLATMANDLKTAKMFHEKALSQQRLMHAKLWNPKSQFFEAVKPDGEHAGVRELIGYLPWYFDLASKEHDTAWQFLGSEKGFAAPYGLTTAERNHPLFRTHGCCKCEWDGAVWPFATSQTLTALANHLQTSTNQWIDRDEYFRQFERYVESQYHRGRPYIGEYLDETTGYWLKGDQERSRYYNHSTFADLIINGLVGLRPRSDNQLEVHPLIPADKWKWFCLDRVPYRGHFLTIVWDETGKHYGTGRGLTLFVDGKQVHQSEQLKRVLISL